MPHIFLPDDTVLIARKTMFSPKSGETWVSPMDACVGLQGRVLSADAESVKVSIPDINDHWWFPPESLELVASGTAGKNDFKRDLLQVVSSLGDTISETLRRVHDFPVSGAELLEDALRDAQIGLAAALKTARDNARYGEPPYTNTLTRKG